MLPERIENRMVVDSEWPQFPEDVKEILKEKGYIELGTENFVPEAEAYEYALYRCLHGHEEEQKEFKEMLVEWFFSGNWIKEE